MPEALKASVPFINRAILSCLFTQVIDPAHFDIDLNTLKSRDRIGMSEAGSV